MSDLATTYLRQARGFLRSGDTHRAVDLLERARLLARENRQVLGVVLEELSTAYSAVGQHDKAMRCRDQLQAIGGGGASGSYTSAISSPLSFPSSFTPLRRNRTSLWLGVGVAAMILLSAAGFVWWHVSQAAQIAQAAPAGPQAQTKPVIKGATNLENGAGKQGPGPQTKYIASNQGPVQQSPKTPTSNPALSLEKLTKESVGLFVVVTQYKGMVGNRELTVDYPTSYGTAFAVRGDGYMLTNSHVVAEPSRSPVTLEKMKLPTLVRRRTTYMVCFGPTNAEHYTAQLIYRSKTYDMALIKIDRSFSHPLPLTTVDPHQGDEINISGYPSVVMDVVNEREDPVREKEAMEKLYRDGSLDVLLSDYNAESFENTPTRGFVKAVERQLKPGVFYSLLQLPTYTGNSGGPVLNSRLEVIGIISMVAKASENVGMALRLAQLKDELAPWIRMN